MINWEAIGAIGEVIAAVAVLITLIYLALQVRNLGADLYSAHLSRIDEGERDLRKLKLEHAELLVKASSNPETLSEIEKFQIQKLYLSHEAFSFFAYLRALASGGNELLHAKIFAESLRNYPAFLPIYENRDFMYLDNPDRIQFGALVSRELNKAD